MTSVDLIVVVAHFLVRGSTIVHVVQGGEGAPAGIRVFGVWECILIASLSLQLSTCASCWHVYRSLREDGVYLVNGNGNTNVSPLEIFFDAQDAQYLTCSREP